MEKPNVPAELLSKAGALLDRKIKEEMIEVELVNEGFENASVKSVLAYLKKEQQKKEINKGFTLVISGGVILLGSFVVTALLFHSNQKFDGFMYVSTIAGIGLSLIGFKKIFG